jgi:hypothetical protein
MGSKSKFNDRGYLLFKIVITILKTILLTFIVIRSSGQAAMSAYNDSTVTLRLHDSTSIKKKDKIVILVENDSILVFTSFKVFLAYFKPWLESNI